MIGPGTFFKIEFVRQLENAMLNMVFTKKQNDFANLLSRLNRKYV